MSIPQVIFRALFIPFIILFLVFYLHFDYLFILMWSLTPNIGSYIAAVLLTYFFSDEFTALLSLLIIVVGYSCTLLLIQKKLVNKYSQLEVFSKTIYQIGFAISQFIFILLMNISLVIFRSILTRNQSYSLNALYYIAAIISSSLIVNTLINSFTSSASL